MKLITLLFLLMMSSTSCSAGASKVIRISEKTLAYEACYPSDQYRPAFEVSSSVSKIDQQTYWEVKANLKNSPETTESYVSLYFKTNNFGKCQFLDHDQTASRLEFMPEDAAVDLARQHYQPYFQNFMQECEAKKKKSLCIQEFTDIFNKDEGSQEERVILGAEDIKALKQLGINAKEPKNNYTPPPKRSDQGN